MEKLTVDFIEVMQVTGINIQLIYLYYQKLPNGVVYWYLGMHVQNACPLFPDEVSEQCESDLKRTLNHRVLQ